MMLWRALIAVELGLAVVAGTAFIAAYWFSPWRSSAAGRHLMALSLVMVCEGATLLAIVVGVGVPPLLLVLIEAAMAAVVIHRLTLLYRARRVARRTAQHTYGREAA